MEQRLKNQNQNQNPNRNQSEYQKREREQPAIHPSIQVDGMERHLPLAQKYLEDGGPGG